MKQEVKQAVGAVKDFLSNRKNWLKIAILITLFSAVIFTFFKQLRSRKEKEVSNEIAS